MWILSVLKKAREVRGKPSDRAAFLKYKLAIWVYFCLWLGLGGFLWVGWHELNPLLSWPLAAIEGIFAPDLSIFRRLFEDFESHTKRALRGEF